MDDEWEGWCEKHPSFVYCPETDRYECVECHISLSLEEMEAAGG